MVLNEPEASLHPSLIPALAGLIIAAGERCQVLVTTHDQDLSTRLAEHTGQPPVTLTLVAGQTRADGRPML